MQKSAFAIGISESENQRIDEFWESGGGPPHSRMLARSWIAFDSAKRPGVRQPSGALEGIAQ